MTEKSLPAQLIEAIVSNDHKVLGKLLGDHPEQLNTHTFMAGQTWLGYACQKGKLEAIRALCDLGADVNLGDRHDGAKPICSAASNGHTAAVRHLLERGADLDVDVSVRNPLFAAIIGCSSEIVSALLESGIDPEVRYNSPTMIDMNAVAFAVLRGERACAEVLAAWMASGDDERAYQIMSEADAVAERNCRPTIN